MRRYLVLALLAVSFGLGSYPYPLHAQETKKVLSVIYSNNLNGEIDSCPT